MTRLGMHNGRARPRVPVSVPTMGMNDAGDIEVTWSQGKPQAFVMTTKALDALIAELNRSRRAALAGAKILATLKQAAASNTTPAEAESSGTETPPDISS